MPTFTKRPTARQDEITLLETQIAINELLPAEMRCDDLIARDKAKLARLRQRPNLKLVAEAKK